MLGYGVGQSLRGNVQAADDAGVPLDRDLIFEALQAGFPGRQLVLQHRRAARDRDGYAHARPGDAAAPGRLAGRAQPGRRPTRSSCVNAEQPDVQTTPSGLAVRRPHSKAPGEMPWSGQTSVKVHYEGRLLDQHGFRLVVRARRACRLHRPGPYRRMDRGAPTDEARAACGPSSSRPTSPTDPRQQGEIHRAQLAPRLRPVELIEVDPEHGLPSSATHFHGLRYYYALALPFSRNASSRFQGCGAARTLSGAGSEAAAQAQRNAAEAAAFLRTNRLAEGVRETQSGLAIPGPGNRRRGLSGAQRLASQSTTKARRSTGPCSTRRTSAAARRGCASTG